MGYGSGKSPMVRGLSFKVNFNLDHYTPGGGRNVRNLYKHAGLGFIIQM